MRVESLFALWALSTCAQASADSVTDVDVGAGRTHTLQVSAAAASVPIALRTNGRASLKLPALEFIFEVRPVCVEPFRAGSISLTVADSRKSLNAEQLEDDTAPSELRLTVPANQIAPVLVTDFCNAQANTENDTTNPGDQRRESLTVPAALSANASLLCVSENEQEIVYTSAPLDLTLICGLPDETAE